jgi:hypothetical protein
MFFKCYRYEIKECAMVWKIKVLITFFKGKQEGRRLFGGPRGGTLK